MESLLTPNNVLHLKIVPTSFNLSFNGFLLTKTLTPKFSTSIKQFPPFLLSVRCSPSPQQALKQSSSTEHTTLLVETFHEHRKLKSLVKRLCKKDSCPLQLLREDGDWSREELWAVVRFLNHASRAKEILQVFDMWKNIEKSRNNELNYNKIIKVLGEEGLMEEALVSFQEMKSYGLSPSLDTYNSIIHGYARKGHFDDALLYLNEMIELNVTPETDTYDGLIEAYGKYKMYDEIDLCLKKMKLNGCPPDHITYNMLIKEFSRGGLLRKMESLSQSMFSKRMYLQSSTLVAMLEAYARFGILDKMEKVYLKVLNLKTPLEEDLIRKLAEVYIEHYMFSRLETLGLDLSLRSGRTDLVWCLRLLSHARLYSQKGLTSVIKEMEEAKIPWNITVANILFSTYLKMKDFTHLRIYFSQISYTLKPDIVTFGILFDAISMDFDGTGTLGTWRRMGFLFKTVEMNTDPLVLTVFGKGQFLSNCEVAYSALEPEVREAKTWTYHDLINLVFKHNGG